MMKEDITKKLEDDDVEKIVNIAIGILNKNGSAVIGPTGNRDNAIKIADYLAKKIDKKYEILFPRIGTKESMFYWVSIFPKREVINPHNYGEKK